jgi:hypothetical protein
MYGYEVSCLNLDTQPATCVQVIQYIYIYVKHANMIGYDPLETYMSCYFKCGYKKVKSMHAFD